MTPELYLYPIWKNLDITKTGTPRHLSAKLGCLILADIETNFMLSTVVHLSNFERTMHNIP